MKLTVFTDYACPFCYIGYELVKSVEKVTDIDVEYCFMEIHPEVPKEGTPTENIIKGTLDGFNNYIAKLAAPYGIKPQLGKRISNSRKAIILRGFIVDKHPEKIEEFDKLVYKTYLIDNLDIGADDVLTDVLKQLKIDSTIEIALNNTMANIKFEMDRSASKENYVDMIPAFVVNGKKLVGAVSPGELVAFIENM